MSETKHGDEITINERKLQCIATRLLNDMALMDQHVIPYNMCLFKWVPAIIHQVCQQQMNVNGQTLSMECNNVRIEYGERQTPECCFRTNTTYACSILVDLKIYDTSVGTIEELKDMVLCYFPIMLYSNACVLSNYTQSDNDRLFPGTFIIRGKTRYIPMVSGLVNNFPFRIKTRNRDYIIHIRSRHPDRPHRSTSTLELHLDEVKARSNTYYGILVKIPFMQQMVPLAVVIIALGGCITDFIMDLRVKVSNHQRYERYFLALLDSGSIYTIESARVFLQTQYMYNVDIEKMLTNEILPHVGRCMHNKIRHLYLYTSHLIQFKEGVLEASDRDNYENIRVATGGDLLASLFRVHLLKHVTLGMKMLRKHYITPQGILPIHLVNSFSHVRLTRGLFSAMGTGNFSKKRLGVTHQLNTTNIYTVISQLRRVSSSCLNADGQHKTPRQVHVPSQYGFICAAETPEGESCGLVQVLALTARVSPETDPDMSIQLLARQCGSSMVKNIEDCTGPAKLFTIIQSNGCIYGYTNNVTYIYQTFVHLKRLRLIHPFTTLSVQHDIGIIWLQCEKGRLIRPVGIRENIERCQIDEHITIEEIFCNGLVQYISPNPLEPIGKYWGDGKTRYTEVTPVSFVGVLAALSPLFRHNQGPRLVYWIGMMKQMIVSGVQCEMGELTSHQLLYGQRAFVRTITSSMLNMDAAPDGVNVIILFYPHSYTQEDAVVFNRASVERGLFMSNVIRRHRHEITKGTSHVQFANPHLNNADKLNDTSYAHIHENGLPKVGTYLTGGDILIGKIQNSKRGNPVVNRHNKRLRPNNDKKSVTDMSIRLKVHDSGIVSAAHVTQLDDKSIAHVTMLSQSIPQVGDKFSSRHSQKGTIGYMEDPENLPFNSEGMHPDIIMSPLGLTSRMTIGKLIECIIGKTVAVTGDLGLGIDQQQFYIPFDSAMAFIQKTLKEHGFSPNGTEKFRDGYTGELIDGTIFMGTVYYTKLNHMVTKKYHARATGPVHPITKQPIAGRKHHGGLRFGPMESECVQAHAASEVLRERFISASDECRVPICKLCGRIAIYNAKINYAYCKSCAKAGDAIGIVSIGHSTKLMIQELQATGIDVKLPIDPAPSH
jgi:DNA-directed RNA polymerase beta subunit